MIEVFSGIFEAAENDEEFAAVIGHEIAHSVAHHGEARLSAKVLSTAMMLPLAPFIYVACTIPGLIFVMPQLLVMVPIVFVASTALLALDRGCEVEADKIGMLLMAEAGFNPEAAISFWEKMDKVEQRMQMASGQKQVAEYQSTHPHVSRGSCRP